MARARWLADKSILIVDKDDKDQNDRTWCYWEVGDGYFEEVVRNQWSIIEYNSSNANIIKDISPYRYKMIHGIDFYNYTKSVLDQAHNISWRKASTKDILSIDGHHEILLDSGQVIVAPLVFKSYNGSADIDKSLYTIQHFGGWYIESDQDVFDENKALLMDFNIPQEGETRFFYVLPENSRSALVEIAIYSDAPWNHSSYDQAIDNYIKTHLKLTNYSITHREYGAIPMTMYPFWKHNQKGLYHIGTAGGVVKPSSGYAFERIQRHSEAIMIALQKGQPIENSYNFLKKRFYRYDGTLLHVILKQGYPSDKIFDKMFGRNPMQDVLRFLNNDTSLLQEFSLFRKLPALPFAKGFIVQ